jgi:hypothetical protein
MTDLFKALSAPFPADRVSWRVGSTNGDKTRGMALAYIDARDVMARLDEVCGPSGWERRHPHVSGTTTCEIAIWIEGRGWVVKCDGAGDTQVEAEKGSLSDSFKRAAVNWGVGRYLYDLVSPWVELEQRGRTSVIKDSEHGKLRNLLDNYGRDLKPTPPAPTQRARKSSAQAKRDGDDAKIKNEIATCTEAGIRDWRENFDSYTATVPVSWLDSIHNMLDLREEELKGAAKVADETDELDAAFRGTMAGSGASGVAGRGGQRQGAAA